MMITLETKVHIPDQVVFHDVDGEMVLLNLESGKYFGLDPVGTRMWELLQEHGQVEAAYQLMLRDYEVDAHTLKNDLIGLIAALVEKGLLQVRTE